ncbi:MAG: dolichyl-phosphate-mannose--protein mannosyltransferase [Ponticaulis sp.]|nr:dolichyl-phosphate-mannose--protein mannosyltransferase [Ponticaulis sp.]|tara:strand:+ start:13945 stop:15888 length:1944 start_codon:yes stop_codon:yes gene_type:complete
MNRYSVLDELSKGFRAYILLFLLAVVTAAPGVFTMPALDRDESRFAQASKQMLETDDYIMIRYQDGLRNKKPAGIHWLQAGSTAIFSSVEARQIWSYRLPSLIGVGFATAFVFWAGIPLIGRRAAFLGAALFSTGLLLTSEAHISKTDGVLVAITTLAVAAYVHLRARDDHPKWLAILFWFAIGFGFLIKGPVTPMVVLLAIVFAGLAGRGWKYPALLCAGLVVIFIDTYFYFGPANEMIGWGIKAIGVAMLGLAGWRFVMDYWREDWLRTLVWWPGPVLFVFMVLPWFISIQMATDGEFAEGAVGKDLKDKVVGASEGHGGPPGYHLVFLLTHFFPATLFLIPAIVIAVREIRAKVSGNENIVFLLAWLIPTWVVFEFLPTKLSHYSLPAYPALALLTGYAVWRLLEGARYPVSRFASLGLFLLGAVGLLVFLSPIGIGSQMNQVAEDFRTVEADTVLASWQQFELISWPLVIALFAILAVIIASLMRAYLVTICFALVCSMTLGLHARVDVLPSQKWVQPTWAARDALREICALPDQEGCETSSPTLVQAVEYAEPSFVFTTGTDVKISPQSNSNLLPAEDAPVMAWVINLEHEAGQAALSDIRQQAATQERCITESEPRYALNYSNGDPVHFVGVRVDSTPCGS